MVNHARRAVRPRRLAIRPGPRGASQSAACTEMTDAFVRVDRQGIVQDWNEPAERLFGFRREDIVGRSVETIIPLEYRERHRHGFFRFVETGTSALPERV